MIEQVDLISSYVRRRQIPALTWVTVELAGAPLAALGVAVDGDVAVCSVHGGAVVGSVHTHLCRLQNTTMKVNRTYMHVQKYEECSLDNGYARNHVMCWMKKSCRVQ